MLDRINNINLNLNNPKPDKYVPFQSRNRQGGNSKPGSDNLSRSEALQFLLERDWHLLEIFFPSEKKMSFSFLVSEIEFKTVIDFSELNETTEVLYYISSERDFDNEKRKLTAAIKIDASENNIIETNSNNDLGGLKSLLNRLFELNISNVINLEENNILGNIYDDIVDSVYYDLSYISSCLFKFIYKLTGVKIKFVPDTTDHFVSLNQVKVGTTIS